MKTKSTLRHFLALAGSSLLTMPVASAATYYWDSNDITSLYGAAGGAWSAPTAGTLTGGWSTSNTGVIAVDGNSVTTGTGDTTNFGTATASSLLSGAITVSGTVNSGNMTFGAGAGNITLSGGIINFAAASTITTNNATASPTNTITSVISGAGTSLTKAGSGILALSGASTYTGFTSVTAGTLAFSGDANVASANALGQSTADAANLRLSNGTTLRYVGSGGSTDRGFTLNSTGGNQGATLNASGTGAINFTNTASPAYGTIDQNRVLTLTGTNTGNNTLGAGLTNNGIGLTSINKTGLGTWVLNGNNTYTGTTTIQGGGTLILDYGAGNGNDSKLGATVLTFSTGAGNLTLRGGSHVETIGSFNLAAGGGHATIAREVGSTATIALGVITRNQTAGVTMSLAAGDIATTTSTVYRGMLGGGITVGSNWAKVGAGGFIVALESGDYTTLTGAVNNAAVNYQLTGGLDAGGTVNVNSLRIERTGTGNQTLDLGAGELRVSAVSGTGNTFGNSGGILYAGGGTDNYTITSTGIIQGQNNSQELIINTFAGTLTLDMSITTGSATAALTKTGAGTLILTKAGTYSGGTNVNQGVLRLRDSAAAGTTGLINVHNGAALELANGVAIAAPLVANKVLNITGTGVSSGGALRNVASNTSSYAGVINIGTGGARINSDASGSLTLTGGVVTAFDKDVTFGGAGNTTVETAAISGAGGVIKDGTGTTTLTFANTYTGGTNVNGGTLLLSGAVSMPSTGALQVNAGGNFSLADGTARTTTANGGLTLAGGAVLSFDWTGASTGDSLTSTATITPTAGSNIGIAINPSGTPSGSVTLLTGATGSTLSSSNFFVANNTNFTASLTTTATTVAIDSYSTPVTALTDAYWKGGLTNAVGAMALSSGTNSNWFSDALGTSANGVVPGGSAVNVIFGATGGGNQSAITTGADMNLGSLTFNDTNAVTISGNNTITLNNISGTAATTSAALASVTAGSAITVTQYAAATNTINANLLLAAGQTWNIASGKTLIVGGSISGANGLTKADTGTLTLSGINTYTGATNVNGGTLIVNGNISTSSLTTVAVGATLGGSGTVGKTVINGTLSVGNSPGQENFTDTLTLNGITIMEIDGNAGAGVAGGHDFVNLTGVGAAGVLTYGGTMTLDMGIIFGAGTYTWNLFDMASETGTFTGGGITLADQYAGTLLDADLNGLWDLTSGSNTWQFTESTGVLGLTVVPEPGAALLGSLGLLALLRRRR